MLSGIVIGNVIVIWHCWLCYC